MRSLIVVGGLYDGRVIPLKVAQFKIGRGPTCHLRPASEDIAVLHTTVVSYSDGKTYVADAGTKLGTLINGRCLIGGQFQLEEGDEITVGPLVFRFTMTLDPNLHQQANDTVAMTPAARPQPTIPAPSGPRSISVPPLPPPYRSQVSALVEDVPAFLTESNIFVISRKEDALDLETLPDFDLDRKDPLFSDEVLQQKVK
jgi:predicted component of type VI protein secretion system